jgi:hypothetical protein
MIPTLVAGLIGLIILVGARQRPEPVPVRVRVTDRRIRRR